MYCSEFSCGQSEQEITAEPRVSDLQLSRFLLRRQEPERTATGKVISIKVLFLCSQNKRRSLTAENIFRAAGSHNVRSAGTETNARIKVTAGLLGWADIIFCMEKKHVRRIKEKYSGTVSSKKVVCLNIPDEYEYMDEMLIELLEECTDEYL